MSVVGLHVVCVTIVIISEIVDFVCFDHHDSEALKDKVYRICMTNWLISVVDDSLIISVNCLLKCN